jgi:ABC-type Fe3+ transport system permease subunit
MTELELVGRWPTVVVAGVLVVLPLAGVVVQALRELAAPVAKAGSVPPLSLAPSWGLLVNTLVWAIGIGLAAAMVAWPVAWVVRARGLARSAWVVLPMALPAYFAYAGYGVVRAPGTPLGNWIEGLLGQGFTLAPLVASRAVAVVGLTLWAWPVAALAMGVMLRRLDDGVLEQSRLELGRACRLKLLVRLSLPAFFAGAGLVALLMIGSAVPLHVSQTPTYAVRVWFEMTLRPGSSLVWLSAWPLLLVGVGAGWFIGARLEAWAIAQRMREGASDVGASAADGGVFGGRFSAWGTGVVMVVSVLVPAALFAWSVRELASFSKFRAMHGEALRDSLGAAILVGAGVAGIAVLVWRGVASAAGAADLRSSLGVRLSVRLLVIAGLTPGILVGLAWLRTSALGPEWVRDSTGVLVLAHLSRYGFVGALVGCWLAASEPRGLRELRALDGLAGLALVARRGPGMWPWWRGVGRAQWGAVALTGVLGTALSLHEIEAAVVVAPAYAQSFAQAMLGYLHFARLEELSVGVLLVLGGMVGVGVVCALAAWGVRAMWRGSGA